MPYHVYVTVTVYGELTREDQGATVMRGLRRMVALVTTSLLTLACQGCVQTGPMEVVSPPVQVYEVRQGHPLTDTSTAPTLSLSATNVWTQSDQDTLIETRNQNALQGSFAPSIVTFGAAPAGTSKALTSFAADRVQEQLLEAPRDQRAFKGEIAVLAPSAQTGLGLDVGIAPRFSMTRDGAFTARRVGGEVRIGQDFDKRGEGDAKSSWYLFAGADGEALVWEPDATTGAIGMSMNDMALRDKVTVGDMQAGISLQRGGGQLSFSYIRREVEYREQNMDASDTEDFAGVSFTLRR